jgi:ubiquinone biosynthesis protein UbiJ
MTVEQIAQLAVTALTTIWGYRGVAAKLTNYVPVDIYRQKVTQLHDEINTLRLQVARLEERAAK